MSVFLERLFMGNMLRCKHKNTKHMHIRQPNQHVTKQSC